MLPQRNLKALEKLRAEGYRLILLSNTNPFMMGWVMSSRFDGRGRSLATYMDACYVSYQCGMMKPDESFFRHVLMQEQILPQNTLFVDDGPRNVAAASQVGIWQQGPGQVRKGRIPRREVRVRRCSTCRGTAYGPGVQGALV